jgi:hypothetical protein
MKATKIPSKPRPQFRNLVTTVNKIISVPSQSVTNLAPTADRSQIETERVQEMLTLMTSLMAREEATIKLIIDCLYDLGYANLINKKVRFRPLNSIAKFIAKRSKPVAKVFAWRWFIKNCPQLIVKWLYVKVQF